VWIVLISPGLTLLTRSWPVRKGICALAMSSFQWRQEVELPAGRMLLGWKRVLMSPSIFSSCSMNASGPSTVSAVSRTLYLPE